MVKKFTNSLCHPARWGGDAAFPVADWRGRNSHLCGNVRLQPVQFQAMLLDLFTECRGLGWNPLIRFPVRWE